MKVHITNVITFSALIYSKHVASNLIPDDAVIARQLQFSADGDRTLTKKFAQALNSDVTIEDSDSSFSGDIHVLITTNQDDISGRTEKILKKECSVTIDNICGMSASMGTLRKLKKSVGIESIEIDHVVTIIDDIPDDEDDTRRDLIETKPGGVHIALQDPAFWETLTPKGSMKICVVDTGYDLGHPDLPGRPDVIGFDNADIKGEKWSDDGHGHGTHVAGTIAALGNNNIGVRGIIPDNKNGKFQLLIAKGFNKKGSSLESVVLRALENCRENGANVISLSLGSTSFSSASAAVYQKLNDEGILVVGAAGNKGNNLYTYPASYSSVMSVASVNAHRSRSYFSQYNSEVEISALGEGVLSTWKKDSYRYSSGTSMATPHVAGIAGLLWMHFPECTNEQIRNVLDVTANPLKGRYSKPQCNSDTGYGFLRGKNAYDLLSQGNCGGFLASFPNNGGCKQLGKQTTVCSSDSDCNDNDPCTIDTCQSTGMCAFETDCSLCGKAKKLTIEIKPDNYPDETKWTLTKKGITIISGGPYPESKPYIVDQCLDVGLHEFSITDAYGDGLCCKEGKGHYILKLDDRLVKESETLTDTSWKKESTRIDVSAPTNLSEQTNSTTSSSPSADPTDAPSPSPSADPTDAPSSAQTNSTISSSPSAYPTDAPSPSPSVDLTDAPSPSSSADPTSEPSYSPTASPTTIPTAVPSYEPTEEPTIEETLPPVPEPSMAPSEEPTKTCVRKNNTCKYRLNKKWHYKQCCDGLECFRGKCIEKGVCFPGNKLCVDWQNGKEISKACCPGFECTWKWKQKRCFKKIEPTIAPTTKPTIAPTTEPTMNLECAPPGNRCIVWLNKKKTVKPCCPGSECFRGKCIKDGVCLKDKEICVAWVNNKKVVKDCCPGSECKWKCRKKAEPGCVREKQQCAVWKNGKATLKECCPGLECWYSKCVKKDVCDEKGRCKWWTPEERTKACCEGFKCEGRKCV